MKIDKLTPEQITSLARLKTGVDYIEALDYDAIDWVEWTRIHRN